MSMKSKSDYLKFMKRLDAEIKIMRQCDHKNIVKFETSITMKDTMCLLMEYLDGEELFDVIANGGAMKEEEAIPIVRQMLSALAYLHERKIMHRDIKPENIMLVKKDGKRVVKLIDFGYGKLVSKSLAQTQVGTREYQAPEVNPINRAYGSGDTYSFAADVFSLGAVVYVFFSPSLSLSHTHSLTLANSLTRSNSSSHTHTHRYAMLSGTFPQFDKFGEAKLELLRASDLGKQVVGRMMRRDPKQRPRAVDILNHAWFQNSEEKEKKNSQALITRPDSLPQISVVTTDDTDFENHRHDDDDDDVVSGPIVVKRNAGGHIIETRKQTIQTTNVSSSSKTTALISPAKYRANTTARDLAVTERTFADMTSIDRSLSQMVDLQLSIARSLKVAYELSSRNQSMARPIRTAAKRCHTQLVKTSMLLRLIAQSAEMVVKMAPDLRLAIEETVPEMAHDFFQSVKKIVAEIKSKSSEMHECNSKLTRELNELVVSCGGMSSNQTDNKPSSPRTAMLLPLIERFKAMVTEKAGENGETKLTPNVVMEMVCCLLKQQHQPHSTIEDSRERKDNLTTPCKIETSTTPTPVDNEDDVDGDGDGVKKDKVEDEEGENEVRVTNGTSSHTDSNAMVCFKPKIMELIAATTPNTSTNTKVRRDSDTEQLKIVWEQLCRADSLLQQFSSFWMNMEVMVDLLMKKNEYIDNFVKYTKNERIQRRFFEHLDMYTRWWMSIQNVCKEYFVATQELLGGGDPVKSVYSFLQNRGRRKPKRVSNDGEKGSNSDDGEYADGEVFRVWSID